MDAPHKPNMPEYVTTPNEMLNNSIMDWTNDFNAQLIKVTFWLWANRLCTNTWS